MTFIDNYQKKIKNFYSRYYPLSSYVLFGLIVMPLYPVIRQYLISSDSVIISSYARFLFNISYFILKLFSADTYLFLFAFAKGLVIDTTLMALWPTFIVAAGCIFLQKPVWQRVIHFTCFLSIIIAFNIIRLIVLSYCYSNVIAISPNVVNGVLVMILQFGLLWFAYYWFKKNIAFKRLLLKQFDVTKYHLKRIVKNFGIAVSLIIVVNFFAYTQLLPIISYISYGVLYLSKLFLHAFGYQTFYAGRYIYNSDAAIFFSDACSGIELMLIYASFIIILNGRNKPLFIVGGVSIIFLMNVLRISLIMIHLIHNHGKYTLPINIHDLYTYPVYIVTFLLWVLWINKFGNKR